MISGALMTTKRQMLWTVRLKSSLRLTCSEKGDAGALLVVVVDIGGPGGGCGETGIEGEGMGPLELSMLADAVMVFVGCEWLDKRF